MSSVCCLLLGLLMLVAFPSIVDAIGEHRVRWVPKTTPACQGSIEDCMEEAEFGMSHRRILATSQYISYKALQRNTVPCSRKGASYYNCKPGAEANPYTRGCPAITRCRNS